MGKLTSIRGMMTILIFGAAIQPGGEPGNTLRHRVDTALRCAASDPEARFIPTGGIGRHPPSEASVMAGLLMKSGVAAERILLEETGHDTFSSVRAIHRLLRERPASGHVMVATSAYHLPRCLILLCLSGIPAQPCHPPRMPAARSVWKRWYWRLREIPAIPYDAALMIWARLTGRL
jgi:vancomycin permeability regulator SanA